MNSSGTALHATRHSPLSRTTQLDAFETKSAIWHPASIAFICSTAVYAVREILYSMSHECRVWGFKHDLDHAEERVDSENEQRDRQKIVDTLAGAQHSR